MLAAGAGVTYSTANLRQIITAATSQQNGSGKAGQRMQGAMRIGTKLWGDALQVQPPCAHQAHDHARRSDLEQPATGTLPFQTPALPNRTKPRPRRGESVYTKLTPRDIQDWRDMLHSSEMPPDEDQWQVIEMVIARCRQEAREERPGYIKQNGEEPLRALIQGLPGCGKSEIIKWVKSFFEQVLGWQPGVEYECVAPMNSMAALIGGHTLHNLAMLPMDLQTGHQSGGKKDGAQQANKLYTKLQNMHFILVDETENASAELLAAFEEQLRDASRTGGNSYAVRADKHRRLFGGINVVMFLDLWQVQPVRQTFIADSPYSAHTARVLRILRMFWTKNQPDSLTHAFILEQSHRCKDPWFRSFLKQAREGALTWDMYNFIHGYGTSCPGSWLPAGEADDGSLGSLMCGSKECEALWKKAWPDSWRKGATWEQMRRMECMVCKGERQRRNRLVQPGSMRHMEEPFLRAPYIHPFNAPKCQASQLRAVLAAQHAQRRLLWCVARDKPCTRDDETRSADALAQAQRRWLSYPNSRTADILGVLPMSFDMPMRFTESVDIPKGACKHTGCNLVGWRLHEEDQAVLVRDAPAEHVLKHLPLVLFVQLPNCTWRYAPALEPGILPVKPVTRTWQRAAKAPVKRTGFPLVPNFSGTAHSFTGTTLPAAIADLLAVTDTAKKADVPPKYVAISRVRHAHDLLLAQAFAPQIFRLGPQTGPDLLVRWLQGAISEDALKREWTEAAQPAERKAKRLAELLLPCAMCRRDRPVDAFPVRLPTGSITGAWYPAATLLETGFWRTCKLCCRQAPPQERVGNGTSSAPQERDGNGTSSAQTSVPSAPMVTDPAEPPQKLSLLMCVRCRQEKPLGMYDTATIGLLRQQKDALWKAKCLECDPTPLRIQTVPDETLTCSSCKRELPAQAFSITIRKRHISKEKQVCEACQSAKLHPCCTKCRKPASKRQYDAPKEYMCETCRYPPCDNGCGAQRPRNGKFSYTRMPAWTCKACKNSMPRSTG